MADTLWSACGKCETKWPAQAHIKHIMCRKTPQFTLNISIDFSFFFSISLLPFVRRRLAVAESEKETSATIALTVSLSVCLPYWLSKKTLTYLLYLLAGTYIRSFHCWMAESVRYWRWKICANKMKSDIKWFERAFTSAYACKSKRQTHFFPSMECHKSNQGSYTH